MQKAILCVILVIVSPIHSKKAKDDEKPKWAQKGKEFPKMTWTSFLEFFFTDIRDFSDADMERLFDQWEEDEEPLPEDEVKQPFFLFEALWTLT